MSTVFRSRARKVWTVVVRPAIAYVAAVLAAALAFILLYLSAGIATTTEEFVLIAAMALVVVPGAIVLALVPALLSLAIIRRAHLPRGLSEVIFGALIGTLPAVFGLVWELSGDAALLRHDIEFLAEIYGSFTFAGTVGGLAYWLAIGLPDRSPPIR